MTKSINEWIRKTPNSDNKSQAGQRQARQFLEEQKLKFTKDLPIKDSKTVKMAVGL